MPDINISLDSSQMRAAPGGLPAAGEHLTGKVLGDSGDGRFLIQIGGMRLTAASDTPLTAGTPLEADVVDKGGERTLAIRVATPAAEAPPPAQPAATVNIQQTADALENMGLPPDAAHVAAAQALEANGVPVTREHVAALVAAMETGLANTPADLSAAAALRGLGLPVTEDLLRAMTAAMQVAGPDMDALMRALAELDAQMPALAGASAAIAKALFDPGAADIGIALAAAVRASGAAAMDGILTHIESVVRERLDGSPLLQRIDELLVMAPPAVGGLDGPESRQLAARLVAMADKDLAAEAGIFLRGLSDKARADLAAALQSIEREVIASDPLLARLRDVAQNLRDQSDRATGSAARALGDVGFVVDVPVAFRGERGNVRLNFAVRRKRKKGEALHVALGLDLSELGHVEANVTAVGHLLTGAIRAAGPAEAEHLAAGHKELEASLARLGWNASITLEVLNSACAAPATSADTIPPPPEERDGNLDVEA
jgi:hypothetical protein